MDARVEEPGSALVLDDSLKAKYQALLDCLRDLGSVAVAFSGGVDSALLAFAAHEALGGKAIAVTGKSPSVPAREIEEARRFCQEREIRHIIVDTHEFDIPGFDHNPPDRCYHCKKEVFSCIAKVAADEGMAAIAEGSNLDDEGDYRPGFAAVAELGVASPLRTAGLYKAEIRAISRYLGLPTWDKPAFACLNSRFAYGDVITSARLAMVDGSEEALRDLGFAQVRVRLQGDGPFTARIEVPPAEIARLAEPGVRERAVDALKAQGFAYVALDLQGYRTGSMNETL